MSISTRTGDDGTTGLYSGERVPKSHVRIELVGTLDELNAFLGSVDSDVFDLSIVQNELFDLGALIANTKSNHDFKGPLSRLDEAILALETELPPLTQFVLPGGHSESAKIHIARAVCRRAERLMSQIETLPNSGYQYLNRLSDYLFLAARKVNIETNSTEIQWGSVL
ncbi:MAG: cob(I)alamin adenosyltransferase [Oceanicoccus sp.]|jgi:cob(I)alamin adenosyltransferase